MPEAQEAGDDGALLLADEGLLDDDDDDGMDDEGTLLAEASGESGTWTDGDEDAPLYELAALTVQGLVAADYTPAAPPAVGGPMGLTMKETAQSVSVVTEQRIKVCQRGFLGQLQGVGGCRRPAGGKRAFAGAGYCQLDRPQVSL